MRLTYAIAVFLVLLASSSFALTNVTTCMQINSSDTYVLQGDLSGAGVPANPNSVFTEVCIRISSDNVTLDCNGHTITGNGTQDIGIASDEEPTALTNITVMNCDVSSYRIGIYANNNHLSLWRNNTAHGNALDGIFLTSLDDSNATLNTASGNNGEGMFVYGSGNNYSMNTVCGNTGNGFRMTGFYSTANNSFFSNTVCNNTQEGMFADISSGILTIYSSGNHFYNNAIDVGMRDNVSLQMTDDIFDNPAGSMANFTILSLSDANTSGGFNISWSAQPAALPAGLQVFGGRFLNISQATSGESIDSAAWSWSDSEPVASLENIFQLWRFDSGGWVALNTTPDTSANALSISNEVPGSVYSILLNATPCPAPINASGTYALTGDTVGEPNDASEISAGAMACVKIGAADVVFDCGGFRIAGDGSATTSYGVALNSSAQNVTVQNCPGIGNYYAGVESDGVNNTRILNTTALSDGYGFSLSSTGNLTVLQSSAANNTLGGFSISTGDDSTVSNSTASGNGGDGFSITSGNRLSLQFDTASGNNGTGFSIVAGDSSGVGYSNSTGNNGAGFSIIAGNSLNLPIDNSVGNNGAGFSVVAGSSPNFAIDNATGNNGTGFSVVAGDFANFAIDTSDFNNGGGFSVVAGDQPNFAICSATGNNGTGFSVVAGSSPNYAIDSATGNSGMGFSLVTGDRPNFAINSAVNNSAAGFSIVSGQNGSYDFNSALGNNGTGFMIVSGNNTRFQGNNASLNTGDGFDLVPAGNNTHQNDYAQSNTGYGFIVAGAISNSFAGASALGNGLDGFLLSGGDGNSLANLTSGGNAGTGLFVSGPNNTQVTNAHLYGNAPDFKVDGTGIVLNMTNATFDSSGGSFTDYTSLSVSDVVDSSYTISHSVQPAPLPGSEVSFANKFVNITNLTANVTIDTLVFNWLDSEVTAGGFSEGSFRLFRYDSSWVQLSPMPNAAANTLTLSNATNFSVFGILVIPTITGGGGTSGGSTPALEISFNSSTGVITVTSGGAPVGGATVKVDGTIVGTTDSDGQLMIPGCNDTLFIDALKTGFTAASATVTLSACPAACSSDSDCPETSVCSAGQCVLVSCPGGTVVNHACVLPQNQTNQTQCVAPSCCTENSQCLDTQACVSASGAPGSISSPGSCQQVSGQCGYAAGHQFIPYNYTCGTEPGCPSCPSGQSCVAHQCVSNDITCPSTGIVGDNLTCRTTQNGQACGPLDNCTATVTLPDGRQLGANPDENGNVLLPLTLPGNYTVTLLKDGQVVKVLRVSALPKSVPTEQKPPTAAGPDMFSLLWLFLLLIIVIAAVVYWRSRSQKK